MNKKRQFALNRLFSLYIIVGVFFSFFVVDYYQSGDTLMMWNSIVLVALMIGAAALFTPYGYVFDSTGVSICFIFLPNERYLWQDVYEIRVEKNITEGGIFEFFSAYVYSIKGDNVGKSRFYMNGFIRKGFRTRYLLEKYWDGTITGCQNDDPRTLMKKLKARKEEPITSYATDEVAPMEQEVRAETREWLKPFIEQANQSNLDLKPNYLYITKDTTEHYLRPGTGYTYILRAEISKFNETDENHIVGVVIRLLYVRLGKTAYRGVMNKHIKEELESLLSEVLNEINRIGIEAYCEE